MIRSQNHAVLVCHSSQHLQAAPWSPTRGGHTVTASSYMRVPGHAKCHQPATDGTHFCPTSRLRPTITHVHYNGVSLLHVINP
uniref:Uncharacterized protein n=1 Tax=Hyaloperonospora arabidopsidis (strain Emoy2) TaxID=559515 RepID=M4BCF3_HYAAE